MNDAAKRLRKAKRTWLLPSEPWDRLIDGALAEAAKPYRDALERLVEAAEHQRDTSPGAQPTLLSAITEARVLLASGSAEADDPMLPSTWADEMHAEEADGNAALLRRGVGE